MGTKQVISLFRGIETPRRAGPFNWLSEQNKCRSCACLCNHFRRLVAQEIRFLGLTKIIVKFFRGQGTFLRCGAGGNFT